MTTAFRYVQNTVVPNAATIPIGSTGKDSQLIAFDITCTSQIAADARADILQWTGAGKIQSIINTQIISPNGSIHVAGAGGIATIVTIDPTGKIINIALANRSATIVADSIIKLLLVIGNY
jgi:hypothetical protein